MIDPIQVKQEPASPASDMEGSLEPLEFEPLDDCEVEIVKEEATAPNTKTQKVLKQSIMAKMQAKGETVELGELFMKPRRYEMTKAEVNKRERRKEQNRRAATKCRIKKKDLQRRAAMQAQAILQENETLSEEIPLLQAEVALLQVQLREHCTSGQCQLNLNISHKLRRLMGLNNNKPSLARRVTAATVGNTDTLPHCQTLVAEHTSTNVLPDSAVLVQVPNTVVSPHCGATYIVVDPISSAVQDPADHVRLHNAVYQNQNLSFSTADNTNNEDISRLGLSHGSARVPSQNVSVSSDDTSHDSSPETSFNTSGEHDNLPSWELPNLMASLTEVDMETFTDLSLVASQEDVQINNTFNKTDIDVSHTSPSCFELMNGLEVETHNASSLLSNELTSPVYPCVHPNMIQPTHSTPKKHIIMSNPTPSSNQPLFINTNNISHSTDINNNDNNSSPNNNNNNNITCSSQLRYTPNLFSPISPSMSLDSFTSLNTLLNIPIDGLFPDSPQLSPNFLLNSLTNNQTPSPNTQMPFQENMFDPQTSHQTNQVFMTPGQPSEALQSGRIPNSSFNLTDTTMTSTNNHHSSPSYHHVTSPSYAHVTSPNIDHVISPSYHHVTSPSYAHVTSPNPPSPISSSYCLSFPSTHFSNCQNGVDPSSPFLKSGFDAFRADN